MINNNSFDIKIAQVKFNIEKTRYCRDKQNHNDILTWMKSHEPKDILQRPVWIIPHSLVGEKICIRPFGLIFISDVVPEMFIEPVVFHEIVEEQNEEKYGSKIAHEIAVIAEYKYLYKQDILCDLMKWLKSISDYAFTDRINIWKKQGFDVKEITT